MICPGKAGPGPPPPPRARILAPPRHVNPNRRPRFIRVFVQLINLAIIPAYLHIPAFASVAAIIKPYPVWFIRLVRTGRKRPNGMYSLTALRFYNSISR